MATVAELEGKLRDLREQGMELMTARVEKSVKAARMSELATLTAETTELLRVTKDGVRLYSHLGNPAWTDRVGTAGIGTGTGSRIAPIVFPEQVMKTLHHAAVSHQTVRLDTKDGADTLLDYLPPTLGPTVGRRIEPTRVAGLLQTTGMVSRAITYPRIIGQTGGAEKVALGGLKPTVGVLTDEITAVAQTIAGLTQVENQSLADFPDFLAIVSTELQHSVIAAENTYLLSDPEIGLLTLAGITRTAATGESVLDVLEQGMSDLRSGSSYAVPSGVVLNPADWSTLRRSKDLQGRYILTPDPTANTAPSLFGIAVVLTTDIAPGTALIGDFSTGSAILHVREGMSIESSHTGDYDFSHNTTTLRVELREALAVTRPTAFCRVTLTPGA